jgi:hypothetical protein
MQHVREAREGSVGEEGAQVERASLECVVVCDACPAASPGEILAIPCQHTLTTRDGAFPPTIKSLSRHTCAPMVTGILSRLCIVALRVEYTASEQPCGHRPYCITEDESTAWHN